MEWDPGPPAVINTIFEQAPLNEYKGKPNRFRLEWGPMYYRRRLDGSAKLIVIGQDLNRNYVWVLSWRKNLGSHILFSWSGR